MLPPQSDVIGTLRTACTTHAMSPSRKISPAFVITQVSSPGCAPLPTTFSAAIRPQRSARIATPQLSPASINFSSGDSAESVEQPWCSDDQGLYAAHFVVESD